MAETFPLGRLDALAQIDPETLGSETPPDFAFYYLDITSVSGGRLVLPERKTRFDNAPSRARKPIRPGDVLMSTVRPNLKAFASFDQGHGEYVASTGFAVLRPKTNGVSHFILHSLFSNGVEAQIRQRVVGSNYPAINTKDVAALLLHSPSKDEQAAIAGILDTVDEAIRQTAAVIEKLKKIKAGLLHDLLTRGIDEDGQVRDPIRHPEQFKDSPLGKVPKTWEVRTLERTATLQRGKDLPIGDRRPGTVPVYGSNGIDGHHDSTFLSGQGVLTGRSGSIGFVFYSEGPYWPLNTTLYVKDFHGNHPPYIAALMRWLRLERFAAATGVPSLNRNFVHPTPVRVPPCPEQVEIVGVLDTHEARLSAEEATLRKLTLMKQGLMQDLLTGRVRVKDPGVAAKNNGKAGVR